MLRFFFEPAVPVGRSGPADPSLKSASGIVRHPWGRPDSSRFPGGPPTQVYGKTGGLCAKERAQAPMPRELHAFKAWLETWRSGVEGPSPDYGKIIEPACSMVIKIPVPSVLIFIFVPSECPTILTAC